VYAARPNDGDVPTDAPAGLLKLAHGADSRRVICSEDRLGYGTFCDPCAHCLIALIFEEAALMNQGLIVPDLMFGERLFVTLEPLMSNVTEIVALEIQKTFDFYRATTEDNQTIVQKILISGGGSKLHGLATDLSSRLELPVEVLDPFRNVSVDERKFDRGYLNDIMPEMAVAVGLAMRGV